MTDSASGQRCYRHPEREAYISCQRCERPICPQCMNEAAVGFQCPECVRAGAKSVRAPRTSAGGAIATNPGAVTLTLIGLNVAMYLVQRIEPLVTEQGAMLGLSALSRQGVELTGVADGGYWRLITSAFLHHDVLHLLLNMVALYFFGPFVERAFGTWRFIAAYLGSAVISSTFVYWLTPPYTLTLGASGAVFALFAMALLLLLKARQDVTTLLVLLAINGALSFRGGISWQGHLGGFIAGLLIGAAMVYAPRDRRTLVQGGVLIGLLIATAAAIVLRTQELQPNILG